MAWHGMTRYPRQKGAEGHEGAHVPTADAARVSAGGADGCSQDVCREAHHYNQPLQPIVSQPYRQAQPDLRRKATGPTLVRSHPVGRRAVDWQALAATAAPSATVALPGNRIGSHVAVASTRQSPRPVAYRSTAAKAPFALTRENPTEDSTGIVPSSNHERRRACRSHQWAT